MKPWNKLRINAGVRHRSVSIGQRVLMRPRKSAVLELSVSRRLFRITACALNQYRVDLVGVPQRFRKLPFVLVEE